MQTRFPIGFARFLTGVGHVVVVSGKFKLMALVQWGREKHENRLQGAQKKERHPGWFRECVGKPRPVTPLPDNQRQLWSLPLQAADSDVSILHPL